MIPSPPVSIPPQEFYDGNRGDIFTQKRILMRSSLVRHRPVLEGADQWPEVSAIFLASSFALADPVMY
jgi:hypothetical protein